MFKFVPDNEEATSDYQVSGFSFTPDEVQPDFGKVKEDSLRSDDGSNVRSKDNMDIVVEWAKGALNPKTYVGAGLAIGKQLRPAIDFARSQEIESTAEALDIAKEVLPEFARGAAREITVNTPKIASNILRVVGTNIKSADGDSFVSQGINGLADTFANISEYMGDIEMLKEDPEIMKGKFSDNPSWKRFANVLGGGTGQGLAMAALARIGGAKLAYGFYAAAGGAEVFQESYEKDKDVGKANTLATISAASTYLIDRWLDPLPDNIAKGAKLTAAQVGKEIAKAAYKEPAAETLQQVLSENLVRKIGIDATQDLYEGMIESAIGALGGAASMGAVSATTYAADRAFNQARDRAIENGATEEEISAFERATMAKLEKHPEAFETVFQQNVQKAMNEIDSFVRENGDTEQARKAMQTKSDLEEVYTRVYDQIKTSDNDKVASAQAKVIQGLALWGSQELGVSPLEYFERRFPRIERVAYREFSRRINEARRANEKPEINLYEALKNPSLLRGRRKRDTRESLTKFLQSRGGLVDTGGELRGMDANKQVRGLINNKNGNNLDDAALAAWEAGYFPQNSERPSINELLEAIDEELRGNKRFASEAEENLQQQVNDLAEELDRADIDWRNMEPNEIEMAVDAYLERQRSYNESMMGEDTGDNGLAWFQESLDVARENEDLDANNPAYEGETININGVERTVYNSNGDRIAMSEPALRNFYNWFGDSKVVDEQGRPLVVYHGTNKKFNIFNPFSWFTSNKDYAEGYAKDRIESIFSKKAVYPVYLSVSNPVNLPSTDKGFDSFNTRDDFYKSVSDITGISDDTVKSALKDVSGVWEYQIVNSNEFMNLLKSNGFDGVITQERGNNTYAAFNPNQIKSTSNRGTYDLDDYRINYQKGDKQSVGHVVKLYTDRDNPSRLLHRDVGNMLPEEKKAWDDFFASRSDAKRIKATLERHKGTPWERLAREEVFTRQAINLIMEGKTPDFESAIDTVSFGSRITSDINSIANILRGRVLSGGSGLKTVHSVNSSFINCNPTPGCAKYCYAASSLLGRNRNWLKPVLIDILAENRPDLLAEMIVDEFKVSQLALAGNKAIRLFDEGDGAPHWLNVVKEINNLGYRVAIFTKRKEFAWDVINYDKQKYGDAFNLVMFSSDASNFNEVEKDTKIPVAFVYSDEAEIPMIKKMAENGQVRVILPIKYKGGKGIANETLQALFEEVPEVKPHVCPIDAGFKKIDPRVYAKDGDLKLADKDSRGWNCAFCDRNGGVGCYHGFSTEKMTRLINQAKELKRNGDADIIGQFQNLFNLIESLKQGDFVNDRRYKEAGFDIGADQQSDGRVLRDVASSETGRRGDVGWLVSILNKRLSVVSGAVKRVTEASQLGRSGEETGGGYQSSEGNRGYDEGVRDDGSGSRSSSGSELSVDEVLYQDRDNTLYRDPKGAYSRRIGQRALISLFERADASTFMHETAHFFFEELKAFAETSKRSRDMLNTINEWLGSDGNTYTEEQIEQFARGFEQYLREGKAPSSYLKRAFDAFLSWMRNLYRTARELNVQLNDDVRSVYANILGGTELDQYMNASPAEVLGNSKKYWKAKREAMDEIYAKNNASKKAAKLVFNRTGQSIQKVYDGMREYLSDAIVPLEEEIRQISPDLYNMNRRLEISKINKTNAYFKRVKGFVEGMSKMSEPDFHTFDLALKNRDTDTVQRLLAKYDLEAGFAEVRNILDELREQMIDVGVDVAYMPDYYPRKVKDADGLLDYIELKFGDRTEYSIIQKMLDEKRRDGRVRTKEDEAQIVNSLIRGYAGGISLANIGNVKDRTLDVIDQYINRFYKVSTDALVDYISGAVQMIENKKYFGRETKELQNLRRMVANRETTIEAYKGMDPKEAKWKEIKTRNYKIGAVEAQIRNTTDNVVKAELQDRKTKLEAEVEYLKDRRASQVKDIAINRMEVELAQVKKDVEKLADSKIENSVGNLLFELVEQGKIGHSQELRLKELLLARFTNKGLGNEFLRIIRDGGYIWTLGNFESAITQFGDLGTSAYKNGLWNTAFEYAKAWTGKSEITIEDLGLGKVINDGGYADTSAWSKALDKVLKYTGFEKMDRIAKQTLVNSSIRKAREQAKAESPELEQYLRHEFGEKWVDVKEDMKTGAITDEILEYAMFQLLDVQPITIDQMPRYYAEGGKKRLFYMMKSYFIKQLNEYRRICFETAKTDPKKAVIDMVRLTGYLMLFNAGADLLKDLLFGRPIDVTDTLVDNVFIGGSINRYQVMNVKREGLFQTLQKQLLFPVMMDEVIVDVLSDKEIKDWNTWKNIPLVGRPYYWWFGGGHLKTEKEEKKLRNQRRNQRRRKED